MTVLLLLLAVSLGLGAGGLLLFLWSVRAGQYEDLEGAAQRILFGEETPPDRRKPPRQGGRGVRNGR